MDDAATARVDPLYGEVRQLMEEATPDEQELSSDDEALAAGLLDGSTAGAGCRLGKSPMHHADGITPAPRRDSSPAVASQHFQSRLAAAFDGLGGSFAAPVAPARPGGARIGPAFANQAKGFALSEAAAAPVQLPEADSSDGGGGEEDDDDDDGEADAAFRDADAEWRAEAGAGGEEEWEEGGDEDGGGDMREWSRQTSSWAADGDSDDDDDDGGDGGGAGAADDDPMTGGGGGAAAGIGAFGGLDDLDELDDGDDGGGGGGAAAPAAADGASSKRVRFDDTAGERRPAGLASDDAQLAALLKRKPKPAAAVYKPPPARGAKSRAEMAPPPPRPPPRDAGAPAAARPRAGFKHYSLDDVAEGGDAGNRQALAQVMQLLGNKGDGGELAAPPPPPVPARGRVMAECVAGAPRRGRGGGAKSRAPATGRSSSGPTIAAAQDDEEGAPAEATEEAGGAAPAKRRRNFRKAGGD